MSRQKTIGSRHGKHQSTAKKLASGIQNYVLRISFRGAIVVNCPYCGTLLQKRINLWTWRIQCSGAADESTIGREGVADPDRPSRLGACGRWFIYFMGLIPIPPGRCVRPIDTMVNHQLRERFPLGEFIRQPRWLSGDAVNRLIDYRDHPPFCCLHNVVGDCGDESGGDTIRDSKSNDQSSTTIK